MGTVEGGSGLETAGLGQGRDDGMRALRAREVIAPPRRQGNGRRLELVADPGAA
jgi:hypothetical protein